MRSSTWSRAFCIRSPWRRRRGRGCRARAAGRPLGVGLRLQKTTGGTRARGAVAAEAALLLLDQRVQRVELRRLRRHHADVLRDVAVGDELVGAADVDADGVAHKLVGELLHLLGPRGGEEEGLPPPCRRARRRSRGAAARTPCRACGRPRRRRGSASQLEHAVAHKVGEARRADDDVELASGGQIALLDVALLPAVHAQRAQPNAAASPAASRSICCASSRVGASTMPRSAPISRFAAFSPSTPRRSSTAWGGGSRASCPARLRDADDVAPLQRERQRLRLDGVGAAGSSGGRRCGSRPGARRRPRRRPA